ncbi:MAG: hypothetical protein KAR87_00555 [Candidatus Aenigmarchaeota archaeon]|nr:hypothetical protein [Candidatus Aenigmarchaeota archaeon]
MDNLKVTNVIIEDITVECELNTNNIPLQKISFDLEKKVFEPELKDFIIVCNRDKQPPNNYHTTVFKNGKILLSNIKRFEDIESIKNKVLGRMKQMGCDYKVTKTRVRESVVRYELKEKIESLRHIANSPKNCQYNKELDVMIYRSAERLKNAYCVLRDDRKDILVMGLENETQVREYRDIIENNIKINAKPLPNNAEKEVD